jgi:hypothetical protein
VSLVSVGGIGGVKHARFLCHTCHQAAISHTRTYSLIWDENSDRCSFLILGPLILVLPSFLITSYKPTAF